MWIRSNFYRAKLAEYKSSNDGCFGSESTIEAAREEDGKIGAPTVQCGADKGGKRGEDGADAEKWYRNRKPPKI